MSSGGADHERYLRLSAVDNASMVATRVYDAQQAAEAKAAALAARRKANAGKGARKRADEGAEKLSRPEKNFVLLFSSHGGTGATTITTTLGAILSRHGWRTCILDLDLQFGDVLTVLDLKPSCPLSELFRDESDDWVERIPRHSCGLSVLSQVGYVEELSALKKKRFPQLLERIGRQFDILLVDGVRDFNDYAISALDASDEVVVITSQDILSLRGLAMRLEVFARLGYRREDLVVVIGGGNGGRVPLDAISESLRDEPQYTIRRDEKAVHSAVKAGKLLAEQRRSRTVRDIEALAEGLFGLQKNKRERGLLGRLRGQRRSGR